MNDSDGAAAGTAPQTTYERFDTRADFQRAVERLLEYDGRELRLFDPDLAALQINSPARIARLEAFLAHSRTRKLFIVLHEIDHVTRFCPRMMNLIARYSHAIEVHRTHEEIRQLQDAFLVLDRNHYVRRPVARFFRGAIGINDESEALAMRSRFLEIWAASYPAVSGATAGLK